MMSTIRCVSNSGAARVFFASIVSFALAFSVRDTHASELTYTYSAKIVCGTYKGKDSEASPVTRGIYATTVNIHNANNVDKVIIKKSFVPTLPPGEQKPSKPIPFSPATETLDPTTALAADCADIRKRANIKVDFFEGILVVHSTTEIEVIAVYTSRSTDEQGLGQGGIDVERVPGHRLVKPYKI